MLVAGLLRIKKFNFQGFSMSQAPQNLPKRTRVLVKDILFQEKYRLTHTQVDIMAYIINALNWATPVGAFFPLTNKKFHEDLPQISEKTLEEALRVLKSLELIEVQMITVKEWGNARVRGISVLPKGLEYNSSYYKTDEQKIIDALKEQIFAQKLEIRELKEQDKESETIEREEKILEEALLSKEESNKYDDLTFTELIDTVTKEFAKTSEPICNGLKGWKKETTFYINSYNKLSIVTPLGEAIQVKNPVKINEFWKYLYNNKDKIGETIDFTKELTIEELKKRYIGMDIVIDNMKLQVYNIEEVINGVKIYVQDRKTLKVATISQNGEDKIFTFKECEDALFELRE